MEGLERLTDEDWTSQRQPRATATAAATNNATTTSPPAPYCHHGSLEQTAADMPGCVYPRVQRSCKCWGHNACKLAEQGLGHFHTTFGLSLIHI